MTSNAHDGLIAETAFSQFGYCLMPKVMERVTHFSTLIFAAFLAQAQIITLDARDMNEKKEAPHPHDDIANQSDQEQSADGHITPRHPQRQHDEERDRRMYRNSESLKGHSGRGLYNPE